MDEPEMNRIRQTLHAVALSYPNESEESKTVTLAAKGLLFIHLNEQFDAFLQQVATWDGEPLSQAEEAAMLRETFRKRGIEPPEWLK